MARSNRPFTDGAGFTRHCWECAHAKGWADDMAACEVMGRFVYKFDSPNNQCSHLPAECRYEPARTAKRVVVSNSDTDHATGHTTCGACGGAIDFWDKWCRHCGARMEDE